MSAAQRYWDANAEALTFHHPVALEWLRSLSTESRILDYGCGYGRVCALLGAAGWTDTVGVDFSEAMIQRGRASHPTLDLRRIDGLPLAEADGAFDAAFLFAVLTCIPGGGEQERLMSELRRLLRPGGLLYLSDYRLQTDDRYLGRYRAGAAQHGIYGVWDREDGGVFRHHDDARLTELLVGFERGAERDIPTRTLSGASAVATQILARRL
jgi:SAM-dependent methyltransferase